MELSFKNPATRRPTEVDDDKDRRLIKHIMTVCRKSKEDEIPQLLKDKMPSKEIIELVSSSEEEEEDEREITYAIENGMYTDDMTDIASISSIQSEASSRESVEDINNDDSCSDQFEERQSSDTQDDDSKERVRWFLKAMAEYDHPSVVIYE
ncbi:hypothetical protein BCV72DRAFT_243428 [Rhizopus microsporus var. microsporus]|uniref:Uncharacterized protein n=2 Tax=Rhizopus microsporus TaxID=58291 RepID=A0A2G4T8D1_RHIZD|nr:uncharacterized protein RHIMIDRAFT_232671 [Rhizopus microsporus ATCC 52813]ORE04661.1 hypothetical protein BCV72DRAFT_243428 [Rhizopus microsporus var. microsporus]PHZ17237.1 hypothetical protein RHIMIDRAFT_232671 [Rhizopus microsporus ATCC 52813]